MTREHTIDAILAAPPASVGAAVFLGFSLSTWVGILTLLYTLILIVIKAPALAQSVRTLVRWIKNRRIDEQSN